MMTARAAWPVVVVFALAWSAVMPGVARAQTIRVQPFAREDALLVSFAMGEAFTDDLRDAVLSGLPVSFAYDVEIRRGGLLWFERTVAAAVVTAAVRYDNLSRKYHVTRLHDGRVEDTAILDAEAAARTWLTAFERLPLFSTEGLEPNGEYSVRVRARTIPRRGWLPWPWRGHHASGAARFTFLP